MDVIINELTMMVNELNNLMILNIKGIDCRYDPFNMSKSYAIPLLKNSVLDNEGVL